MVREAVDEEQPEKQSILSKTLWYLPNRVMDLVDVFRLRVKFGPGIGVGLRVTDYASLYWGKQHTVYVGLPGPRNDERLRWPVGFENMDGIVMAGVDASDDVKHPPRYESSEVDANIHLGLIGAEAGISPMEIADFFCGFIGLDIRDDDYPRTPREISEEDSVISYEWIHADYQLQPKPREFNSFTERIDYIQTNVPMRLRGNLSFIDQQFVPRGEDPLDQPHPEDIVFGLYFRSIVGDSPDFELKPDVDLEVELPNLEKNVKLFIESSTDDDLSGRDQIEKDDSGWTLGLRNKAKDNYISTDVGIRTKIPPVLYTRLRWRPHWTIGDWHHHFEQRFFWESDDGLGVLTSYSLHRWLRDSKWIYKQNTSGKITQKSDGYEWQQYFAFGKPIKLLEENKRKKQYSVGSKDLISGREFSAYIFGSDTEVTEYRTTVTYSRPLHREIILGELRTGPQWRRSQGWSTELRLELGVRMLF